MKENTNTMSNGNSNGYSTSPLHAVESINLQISGDLQSFGAEQSAKVAGNPKVLYTHFDWFFQDAMRNANGKNHEQQKKIDELVKEISGLESHNESLKNSIIQIDSRVFDLDEGIQNQRNKENGEIKELKEINNTKESEIIKIKNGDYSVLGTEVKPGDRLGYYLGFIIWSFLTMYLIIFYTSVIYSAFILDINQVEIQDERSILSTTIVNLEAIPKTFHAYGFLGVCFLLFATMMFIALGYLIHKFNANKQYFRFILVYLFTLVFDGVLAFTIVKNIYEAKRLSGLIEDLPFEAKFAFYEMDFYIILMAGFMVYIIWGFILEYIISEYDNIVPARVGIKSREAEIRQNEEKILDVKNKFSKIIADLFQREESLKDEKGNLLLKIDNNMTAIDVKRSDISALERTVSISIGDLKTKISQFLIGWCGHIRLSLPTADGQTLINQCHSEIEHFYKTIKID